VARKDIRLVGTRRRGWSGQPRPCASGSSLWHFCSQAAACRPHRPQAGLTNPIGRLGHPADAPRLEILSVRDVQFPVQPAIPHRAERARCIRPKASRRFVGPDQSVNASDAGAYLSRDGIRARLANPDYAHGGGLVMDNHRWDRQRSPCPACRGSSRDRAAAARAGRWPPRRKEA